MFTDTRTALITVGLFAALVFGIIVLAGGDWIPGVITVIAAVVGLARTMRTNAGAGRFAASPDRQGSSYRRAWRRGSDHRAPRA